MIKKKIALVLLLTSSILVTSCDKPVLSDSSSSTSPSSQVSNSKESSSSKVVEVESSIDSVFNLLSKYISGENYSLSQTFNSKEYLTKYTSKAIYDEWSKKGQIELDSFDTAKYPTTVLYNFNYDENGNISIGVPTHNLANGQVTVFQYISQLNYLKWLSSSSFKKESFKEDKDKVIYSTDNLILKTFANLVGKADLLSSSLDKVEFKTLEKNELEIKLIASDTNGSYQAANMILKDLNSTSIDKVDDFVNNFKLPSTKLTSAQLSDLTSDSFTATTTFTSYYLDGRNLKTQENIITSKNNMLAMESIYYTDNTSDYRLFGKGEDGKVHKYGIDAQNNFVDEKRDVEWADFALLPSLFTDFSAFLSDDGVNFKYYGALGESLAYSLTYAAVSDPTNITLKVENDKVKSLEITYPLDSDENGDEYIEKASITLSSPLDISIPTPYKESSDTPKIKEAFDAFLNEDFMFVEKLDDKDEFATKVFSTNSTLYYETLYSLSKGDDDISNVQTNYGYHKVSSSQVEYFKVDEKGVAKGNKVVENKNVTSYSNFSFNPNAFEIKGDYIVPKKNILKISENFFTGIYYQNSIVSPTMKMKFDQKTNRITSITYDCQPNEIVYKVKLDFTYDNVSLPSYLNNMKDYVPFEKPATWLDEKEGIKEKMTEMFTEQKAKLFPYLYDVDLKGLWNYSLGSSIKGHEVLNLSCYKKGFDNVKYIENYINLLDGYKLSTGTDADNNHNYNIYENEELKIGIAIKTDYKDDSYINLYFFSL